MEFKAVKSDWEIRLKQAEGMRKSHEAELNMWLIIEETCRKELEKFKENDAKPENDHDTIV